MGFKDVKEIFAIVWIILISVILIIVLVVGIVSALGWGFLIFIAVIGITAWAINTIVD